MRQRATSPSQCRLYQQHRSEAEVAPDSDNGCFSSEADLENRGQMSPYTDLFHIENSAHGRIRTCNLRHLGPAPLARWATCDGRREWCARGDSNPHCPRFEGGASGRLGYARGVRLRSRTGNREGLSLAALPVGVGGRPPSPRLRRTSCNSSPFYPTARQPKPMAKVGAPGWIRTSNLRYL